MKVIYRGASFTIPLHEPELNLIKKLADGEIGVVATEDGKRYQVTRRDKYLDFASTGASGV